MIIIILNYWGGVILLTCSSVCLLMEEPHSDPVLSDEDLPGSQESLGLSQGTINELMEAIKSNGYGRILINLAFRRTDYCPFMLVYLIYLAMK